MLPGGVGRHQLGPRALHGAADLPEQFAHVARMIMHVEFLGDDLRDDGRGPDAGLQSIGHRAALDDIAQTFGGGLVQSGGAAAAVTFVESRDAVPVPGENPGVSGAAVDVQQPGDIGDAVLGQAEHDALDAQRDTRSLVGLGLLAQGHEVVEGSRVAFGESRRAHGLGLAPYRRSTSARMIPQ